MNTRSGQPLTDLAELNPRTDVSGLTADTRVSFIPMADVSNSGKWIGRQERRLDEVRIGYTPFADNDLLFAKITPCMENGKGAHVRGLTNGIGFGSTEFHVLRAKGENSARFVFHWLQAESTRSRAVAFMGGSAGQQRVQSAFFGQHRIPEIPPAQQVGIAAVLDAVDEAIAETEAVIVKLKQVRTGLLHDLLTRGLDENGELRDPDTHPNLFNDSCVGRIPHAWPLQRFSDTVESASLGTPLRGASAGKPRISLVKMGNLVWGDLRLQEIEEIDIGLIPNFEQARLRYYDFLFNTRNTPDLVGKTAVWRDQLPLATYDNNLLRIRFKPHAVAPFACLWMSNGIGRNRISAMATATTSVAAIYWRDLANYIIPTPARDEQERVVAIVDAHDVASTNEAITLVKLYAVKAGLMSDLLTGRVRVPPDLLENPA